MREFFQNADALLRGASVEYSPGERSLCWRRCLGASVVFGLFYGAAMGCFGGASGERVWQIVFSAIKVPLLLLVTFGLALPSFFVFNTLLGVRDDFSVALRALLETQAGIAMILASLAPLTLVFYASSTSYEAAVLFNFLMFALASASAQLVLRRRYRALIVRREKHRRLLWAWLLCYGFIGVQLGWVLRPFVGAPDAPVRFFREGAWGNIYEVMLAMIWKLVI